ncbi:uncharacterized protein [Venturia canescens]|uniref:uncharacterized protein isoform X2 n=1 Tax=Venturia canescens TaxID=32260 RepID=UPI001C9CBBAF|nr:uncharacterized protein LOC122416749 isoform X2 [Venturia canescens]
MLKRLTSYRDLRVALIMVIICSTRGRRLERSSASTMQHMSPSVKAEYDGKNFNSNGKTISPLIPSDSTMVQQKLDDFSPDPCENANFCENPSFYPEDLIREALKHRNDLKYSTVVDPMPDKNGTDTGEQDVLCQTKISLVYPRMAKNRANESLFIVNDDFFRQAIQIPHVEKSAICCRIIKLRANKGTFTGNWLSSILPASPHRIIFLFLLTAAAMCR